MFTLLVSWLLVACVPGLLMLAALGLGRLEKELAHDSVTATDVVAVNDQAEAMDMRTLAREGMPEALEYLHRRQALQLAESPSPESHAGRHRPASFFARDFAGPDEAGLPTRNTHAFAQQSQFNATRHVNRV
ncbi:MAG: hypothetical protein WBZ37_30660 [Mycobacterium sp.]